MYRVLLVSVILCCALSAHAQEFKLKLTYTVDGTPWAKPLYLGYDPSATDTFDHPAKWPMPEYPEGEVEVPPAGFGNIDCRFTGLTINRPKLGEGCYIDIRQKPTAPSFALLYEIDIIADGATAAKFTWDRSSFPALVKHLYLATSASPNRPRLDMVTTGEFNIPVDSMQATGKYQRMVLTLLYNEDSLAVSSQNAVSRTSVYPTMVEPAQRLHLSLAFASTVDVIVFDALGRAVRSAEMMANEGVNELPSSLTQLPAGTYVVDVRDRTIGGQSVRQKFIVQ